MITLVKDYNDHENNANSNAEANANDNNTNTKINYKNAHIEHGYTK